MKENNWKTKLASRKFWVPMVTAALIWFDSSLDLEQIVGIITLVAAFIFGESHVDATVIKGDVSKYINFLETSLSAALTQLQPTEPVEGVVE